MRTVSLSSCRRCCGVLQADIDLIMCNTAITQLFTGYQTKYKDNKFYGISYTCPFCTSSEEALTHGFTFASTEATCNCSSQVDLLPAALTKMGTPPSSAVLCGIQEWTISQNEVGHRIRPNSCGSVIPAMIILTQAFIEQTEIRGWDQILRGWVCIHRFKRELQRG